MQIVTKEQIEVILRLLAERGITATFKNNGIFSKYSCFKNFIEELRSSGYNVHIAKVKVGRKVKNRKIEL